MAATAKAHSAQEQLEGRDGTQESKQEDQHYNPQAGPEQAAGDLVEPSLQRGLTAFRTFEELGVFLYVTYPPAKKTK
jgi:hypothetical protein